MLRAVVLDVAVVAVVAVVAALAGCAGPSANDEDAASVDQGIINGRAVTNARPAVGYLTGRDDDLPWCTATLVAPEYIVTAAHCVRGTTASTLVFGTGVFRKSGASRTSIKHCKSNPAYRDTDPGAVYDFAYCKLANPITTIAPLAFVMAPSKNASYLALAYGQTDNDDDESAGPRRQLVVHRVDPATEPLLEGLEEMLATTSKAGDTCFGDSGSPLLVISTTGVARIAGVLHAGVSYEDDLDCSPGGLSIYAPAAKNAAFFATRE